MVVAEMVVAEMVVAATVRAAEVMAIYKSNSKEGSITELPCPRRSWKEHELGGNMSKLEDQIDHYGFLELGRRLRQSIALQAGV